MKAPPLIDGVTSAAAPNDGGSDKERQAGIRDDGGQAGGQKEGGVLIQIASTISGPSFDQRCAISLLK